MADICTTLQSNQEDTEYGDCEDVDKLLMVIVKRRKTIPTKCMEINREISTCELSRLENIKVMTEEHKEKEKFRKMIQGFKKLEPLHFTFDDMNKAEEKLEKYYKRTKEINSYLERRRKYLK